MQVIQGRVRDYAWGSPDAIPKLFGMRTAPIPVAELWLGGHADAPARTDVGPLDRVLDPADLQDGAEGQAARVRLGADLHTEIARDPVGTLGEDVTERFGPELPYLMKLIAPGKPLSMQVHPSIEQARAGYAREEAAAAGGNQDPALRSYRDRNHKPELVYALSDFEAVVGFRTPRRIMGVLKGLGTPLTDALAQAIRAEPNAHGVRQAFASLLAADTRPAPECVQEVVDACRGRTDSPSPRADATVAKLAQYYPGDPGVVASLLLNPVTLRPGEAMFTPAGTVHAYTRGFGIEIMANSDNVLRAGLTKKRVDVPELLAVMQTVAAPPIRIAPEAVSPVQATYYAPVDDFELSIITLRDSGRRVKIHGLGPRILFALAGACEVWVDSGEYRILNTGQAVFIRDDDGAARLRGAGRFVLAAVP